METIDQKYVVFKRESFMHLLEELVSSSHSVEQVKRRVEFAAVPDAVVIRLQDAFAGPMLASYAACMAVVIEVFEKAEDQAEVIPAHLKSLRTIADYFSARSVDALDYEPRLPD